MSAANARRCIALLGGSFDPPHNGHVALAAYLSAVLRPDELRVVPAGQPWQKAQLSTSARDRAAMVEIAFRDAAMPVVLDHSEVERAGPSYTIDTLTALRRDAGAKASLVLLMGADQLQRLDTWRDWQRLFEVAHLCVASRPGFSLDALPDAVRRETLERDAGVQTLRDMPCGRVHVADGLAEDVSSTAIRALLATGRNPDELRKRVPVGVLDYIQQHQLYRR